MSEKTDVQDFSNGHGDSQLEERKPPSFGQENRQLEDFLQKHHGRTDLNPTPSLSLNDPLNWPSWKKHAWLVLVSFHAFFALFMFAGLIPGYQTFAKDYNVSLTQASYLTSVQILFAGVAPIFWNPFSSRYGRRPILLISTLGACVCNIGGARSYTYGAQITTRILNAIFICPPLAIGSGVVAETFFRHERAKKMGVWTLLVTISTAVGPFLLGFLFQRQSVSWVFWLYAIVNFCQFLGYFFLNAESLYYRPEDKTILPETYEKKQRLFSLNRINPTPLGIKDFFHPLIAGKYISIVIPAIAYALVFAYAGVAITVEMPQVMGEKFHLDPQQTGLQFIAIVIGSVIGEQLSGPASDWLVHYVHRRRLAKEANGGEIYRTQTIGGTTNVDPIPRLYLAYVGFITAGVGLIVWGIESQVAKPGNWTVTPLVGTAIAAFGNQVVTTTLVTFAVDCHRTLAAEIGVFINFVRQVWGFIGPFYFADMFERLGFGGAGGLMAGIIIVVAGGITLFLQVVERKKWSQRNARGV